MSRPTGFLSPTTISGTNLVLAANDWFESLGNDFEGATPPPLVFEGMLWRDTSTSPAVLKVRRSGAWVPYGFGGFQESLQIINTDWNTIETLGVSFFTTNSTSTPNLPTAASDWFCMQSRRSGTAKVQQAFRPSSGEYAVRRQTGGTWTAWDFLYSRQNIVGAVSQVGGVPTGAVVETGSNATGRYTRWADGTQICQGGVNETVAIATAFSYGGFQSPNITWTFPSPFVSGSSVGVQVFTADAFGVRRNSTSTITEAVFNLLAVTSQATQFRSCSCIAIGRWF